MEEKNHLKAWHGLLASALAILFLWFGGYLLYPLFGEIGGYLAPLCIALIAIVIVWLTKTKVSEVFPFRLPSVREFFTSVGMYIGITMLGAAVTMLLMYLLPQYTDRDAAINDMVRQLHPVVAILLIAVQPAVCEEFFCRGFLISCLRRCKREWTVIVVTALVFGALHLDFVAFFPTALLGGLFAYLAIRTRSLLLPIFFHFVNNAISTVTAYGASNSEATATVEELTLAGTIGLVLFYLGLAVLFLYVSSRLFLRKKIFTKSGIVLFVVAAILFSVGNSVFAFGQLVKVFEVDTVAYTDETVISYTVLLTQGVYQVYASAVSVPADGSQEQDTLRIDLSRNGEVLASSDTGARTALQSVMTLSEGEYTLTVVCDAAEVNSGTAVVSVMVMQQE